MKLQNPDIRYLYDMKEVIYDQPWAETASNLEIYYMYRGLNYDNGLRYDITVMPFQMLGKEFAKTKGHCHPDSFTELYEVIEGAGFFFLQKCPKNSSSGIDIEDVYVVKAEKGDKVFVPPYYGHITINPGPASLKMSNWVADCFKADYSLFQQKQGACYYAVREDKKIKWVKNKHYCVVPSLRFEKPNQNIPEDLKTALLPR